MDSVPDEDQGVEEASVGPPRPGRYPLRHGDASGLLHSREGQPTASAEDARPPGFPSVGELCELNRVIHEDAGQPERFRLDQPAPLESCLDRARTGYSASAEGVIRAASLLAHGIAQAQAFRDGNRRTAYFATQAFLNANGLGYLSPETKSDHHLARKLNQVVENQARMKTPPSAESFEMLLQRRLKTRRG
ncbi:MAG: Fic family protein [Solirubrobacteraceae bacterium]